MTTIAFFSKYLPSDKPNGVSVQVHRLAQALVRREHVLTCFSFSPRPPDAVYKHVKLSWGGTSKLYQKLFPAIAFSKVQAESFDILHYHGDDYLCGGSAKRIRTFYGSALQEALHAAKTGRCLYQSLFYLFEWISCLQQGTLAGISVATRKSLPRVKNIIPCCIPLERYTMYSTKSEKPSILFLGDLDSRKQGHLVLETFTNVVLPAIPDSTLTIVGPQYCSGKGIRYLGNLDEDTLIKEYQRSWIYCMASSYEGFGVPVIEACACGTPVVAICNRGTKEIITHGHNGMLCSADSLGKTIIEVLHNAGLRQTLSGNGRAFAEDFDSDLIAQRYEKLYERILYT